MPIPIQSPTEARHPGTADLDLLPTADLLRVINAEDATVPGAVAAALPEMEQAVELAVAAVRGGGRVHYFGAGSSGRAAAMDAAELPPTYGVADDLVQAHHAGGDAALGSAVENVEDDEAAGARAAGDLGESDIAIGLAASGRTPFVIGALREAGGRGAPTVLISSNPGAAGAAVADVHICVDTGPEVVAGSTRMKAGTAQKLVLNSLSTALMVRLGHTYSNLMVGVVAKNEKLRGRMIGILTEASGHDVHTCASVLEEAGGDLRVAIVCLLADVPVAAAADALHASHGVVRDALARLG